MHGGRGIRMIRIPHPKWESAGLCICVPCVLYWQLGSVLYLIDDLHNGALVFVRCHLKHRTLNQTFSTRHVLKNQREQDFPQHKD